MGPCGNVWKFVLVEGKYAILGPGWTMQETEPSVDPDRRPCRLSPALVYGRPRGLAVTADALSSMNAFYFGADASKQA
jgi:hypothetical protein